jgi:nucleotide-binding universal stress UspA family protein
MRILVAVDVHDRPEQVVAHAIPWARRLGGRIFLVFVSEWSTEGLPPPPFPTEELAKLWASWNERAEIERRLLDAVVSKIPQDVRGDVWFRGGRPVEVLRDLASEYDLLVVATHSRHGLQRVVLGSVTARLVRRAVCPVLVVGLGDPPVEQQGPLSVLVPLDGEDAGALPFVQRHFASDEVELLHVTAPEMPALLAGLESPSERLARLRQVSNRLEEIAAGAGFARAPLRLIPRETSNPGDTIARVAHEQGTAVIVMPTHSRTGLEHLMLGSVAERVVDKASCPVIIVPKVLISSGTDAELY